MSDKPSPGAMLETLTAMANELSLAEEIVKAVLANLDDRNIGLDMIDAATKAEMVEDLEDTVADIIAQWVDKRA